MSLTALSTPALAGEPAPLSRLDRAEIESLVRSGRRLIVQGGMGIHVSDGLSGKVAAHRGPRLVGAGTVSAVLKTSEHLRAEIGRARAEAAGGFVGVNLMAAVNRADLESSARIAIEERVSFVVQGAGISREVVRWCRDGGVPFAGIVSSGRLAALYEKWGADFLVAEGAEAGGHLGDVDHPLPSLLDEVLGATSLPVVAAGGVDAADVPRLLAAGAAGVQLATRFIASRDGDAHGSFKTMHLGKEEDDVVLITSCVKGMKARAVRNSFTEALARGQSFPPRSKAWFYGREGFQGRRKACIECLGAEICLCRSSGFRESFCITDALLAAAVKGDVEHGLFYTGQSLTRIPERALGDLPDVRRILSDLEARLADAEERAPEVCGAVPASL